MVFGGQNWSFTDDGGSKKAPPSPAPPPRNGTSRSCTLHALSCNNLTYHIQPRNSPSADTAGVGRVGVGGATGVHGKERGGKGGREAQTSPQSCAGEGKEAAHTDAQAARQPRQRAGVTPGKQKEVWSFVRWAFTWHGNRVGGNNPRTREAAQQLNPANIVCTSRWWLHARSGCAGRSIFVCLDRFLIPTISNLGLRTPCRHTAVPPRQSPTRTGKCISGGVQKHSPIGLRSLTSWTRPTRFQAVAQASPHLPSAPLTGGVVWVLISFAPTFPFRQGVVQTLYLIQSYLQGQYKFPNKQPNPIQSR